MRYSGKLQKAMKRCPQCQVDYFDQMLEFCVEDGAKLVTVNDRPTAAQTEVLNTAQNSVETFFFKDQSELPQTVAAGDAETYKQNSPNPTQVSSLKEKAVEKGYRALEIAALVFALAHNWWQWLYVDRQNYGSASNFLLSIEFLVWILLLAAGATAGLLSLKLSRQKTLAYAGLVILAVNFLLLIVPRK